MEGVNMYAYPLRASYIPITSIYLYGVGSHLVFSRTNCLYVDESRRIYNMSADPNNVTTKSFPLPSRINYYLPAPSILPTPDKSQIPIHGGWYSNVVTEAQIPEMPRDNIIGINFSCDALV